MRAEHFFGQRQGHEGRVGDGINRLLQAHVDRLRGFKLHRRLPKLRQTLHVQLLRKTPVLLEGRFRSNQLAQVFGQRHQPLVLRILHQQAAAHEVFHHRGAKRGGVDQLGQLRAAFAPKLAAQPLLGVAQGGVELLRGDFQMADFGDFPVARRGGEIGVQAEDGKRQGQNHQNDLGDAGIVADDIKHGHGKQLPERRTGGG